MCEPVASPTSSSRATTFTPRNSARSSKQHIFLSTTLSLYTNPFYQPLYKLLHTLHSDTDLSHRPSLIDGHLSTLSELLLFTSRSFPPRVFQHFKRPGWGSALKASKKGCRQSYHQWICAGKPRNTRHPTWITYKPAKKQNRTHIRVHKKLSDETFYNSLDLELDSHRFFQAIRNHTSIFPTNPILTSSQ